MLVRLSSRSARLPGGIWALGFVSMFMDMSSELIHSLLPVFMATVLGASMVTIGLVEGVAEGVAAAGRVVSGALSDYVRRRKPLVVLGYGLAALTKPIFPLATTIGWVFGARFVDRVAKGIRGAPRDALIADLAPPDARGAAYGLRQALDTVGAVLGPMLALGGLLWFAGDIRAVLWMAVIPAVAAVGLLMVAVPEPADVLRTAGTRGTRLTWRDVQGLRLRYWLVVALGAVFTLARFSEAFLILRAQHLGLALGAVPAVLIALNVCYAGSAYPAGTAADRVPARTLLAGGLVLLIVADVVLALALVPGLALVGAALWGLHMGFTQGLFSKLVVESVPVELRGTAFGIFNLISGGSLVLASVLAGWLWSRFGPPATFLFGAAVAALAALGLFLYRPRG